MPKKETVVADLHSFCLGDFACGCHPWGALRPTNALPKAAPSPMQHLATYFPPLRLIYLRADTRQTYSKRPLGLIFLDALHLLHFLKPSPSQH